MVCRLIGARPLPEPIFSWCSWTLVEQTRVELELTYNDFRSRKCIWILVCKTVPIIFRPKYLKHTWNVCIWMSAYSKFIHPFKALKYSMFYDEIIYSPHKLIFHWTTDMNLLLPSEAHNSFHQLTFFLPVFEPHVQSIKPLLGCTRWHACAWRCYKLAWFVPTTGAKLGSGDFRD